jgi:hypothetical protein
MTDQTIATHLTDRDRLRALYGEPLPRPEYVSPFERNVQELLDLSDRLTRGMEAAS